MNQICNTPLWDNQLTWYNEEGPDFTPCFQETILVWFPAAFLIIFGSINLIHIYRRPPEGYIQYSKLNSFKLLLTFTLIILAVIELVDSFIGELSKQAPLADLISPCAKIITFSFVFVLLICFKNRGVHTSSLLFIFWFFVAVASIINFQSLLRWILREGSKRFLPKWRVSDLRFKLRLVGTPIVVIQFVLSCIADSRIRVYHIDPDAKPSPEIDASVFSWLTFSWLDSFIWKGYKRPLVQSDLYALRPERKTENISKNFNDLINESVKKAVDEKRLQDKSTRKREPSLTGSISRRESIEAEANKNEDAKYVSMFKIITKAFWPRLLLGFLLKILTTILSVLSPVLLGSIITFVSSDEPNWHGLLYAFGLFIIATLETITNNQETSLTNSNVVMGRTCVTSALYRKTLRLSNRGKRNSTTGQIVNLMSVDAQRVADFIQNFNTIIATPTLILISLALLYQQLGVSTVAGLLVMIFNIPFNAFVTMKVRFLQQNVMRMKDRRLKLLSEILGGIKIIKIYAWEDAFKDRIDKLRLVEIKFLKKQSWYTAMISFAYQCLPFVVILSSFTTFILIDRNNILNANKIFVSLSLFNIIRTSLVNLPNAITNFSLCLTAVKRLNEFFEREEIDPSMIKQIKDRESYMIRISDGQFKWDNESEFLLDHINIVIPKGKLVAIVGPVGSGKSSLLSAMMGDLELQRGRLEVDLKSSIAYVPQEAWILNETVRNNINVRGRPLNEVEYSKVLEACALVPDLKTLPKGDLSEIGEKGFNLSGGQKQRISLARAVYFNADTYMFDDPLSAVDAHVGRHIFDEIIGPKGLISDKTRILVTNKLSVLPEVDEIFVLKDGKITEHGTYEELLTNRGLFSELLVKYLMENLEGVEIEEKAQVKAIKKELARLKEIQEKTKKTKGNGDIEPSTLTNKDNKAKKSPGTMIEINGNGNGNGNNLTGQERSAIGAVGWKVHFNFARTMGSKCIIAIIIYLISGTLTIASSLWLSDWSNDSIDRRLARDETRRNIRLGIYATLGLSEAASLVTAGTLLNFSCLRASKCLHEIMTERVLKAPLSWFNITPSGRILNRFSKDVDAIDVSIRSNLRIFLIMSLRSIASLILVSLGSVYSIVLIVLVVIGYIFVQLIYIPASRQLKRIESTTRSPIYTHFSETISGVTSIRAFKMDKEFEYKMDSLIDTNNSSYYMSFTAARWLTVRLRFLGIIIVLIASLAAVISRGAVSPGLASLSVTYSLTITSALSVLVKSYSDYETNVVSVERLIEYCNLPIEPEDEEIPSDPKWPSDGKIVFDNYSARYRPELDLVVKDFNLIVESTEKVGLVGRTGAGKSSIILAVFRLFEPASGQIIIDDISIAHVNLKYLRTKLSIIPQEPVLFTGTIRQNLDPANIYTDDQLWRAIELAHLMPFMRTLSDGLDHDVAEGGSNMSVGQRQLFCLARALLKRSKILILDEATAAVDLETDNLIQQTIRTEFKDSSIMTVAHRLETIIDYDRIVVMDNGRLVEVDSPSELIKRPDSKFFGLAKEAGLTK